MKDYLNQDEHRLEVYYMCCYGYLTVQLQSYGKNMSKEEKTYAKYIATYINKKFEALEKRVGKDETDRIIKDALNCSIRLLPKDHEPQQFMVKKEPLEGALLYAVEAKCKNCNRTDYKQCNLYKCMDECGMGSASERKSKVCEYSWEE